MQSLQLQYRMNPAYQPTGSQRSKYFYCIIWDKSHNRKIDYGYEYVLVTNENVKSPNKIPAACNHFEIKHMNLFQFFEANGFEFRVNKK